MFKPSPEMITEIAPIVKQFKQADLDDNTTAKERLREKFTNVLSRFNASGWDGALGEENELPDSVMPDRYITRRAELLDNLESELCKLAIDYRSSLSMEETNAAIAAYHAVYSEMCRIGHWHGIPDADTLLPDTDMPPLFEQKEKELIRQYRAKQMAQKTLYSDIPGLIVYPDYFSKAECAFLVKQCLQIFSRLEDVTSTNEIKKAHIPQPEFVRSSKHNLASEEFYTSLTLDEVSRRSIQCEYFQRYGEEGHSLCYFRGNNNLPDFVHSHIGYITSTMQEAGLTVVADNELTWKLTMNFYKNVGGVVAGFPFHVDIPANGVVTMILNVQREALFQIAKNETVVDINLPVGSLLVLSGESRYEWKHRVLPMAGSALSTGGVERISLVLGFQ